MSHLKKIPLKKLASSWPKMSEVALLAVILAVPPALLIEAFDLMPPHGQRSLAAVSIFLVWFLYLLAGSWRAASGRPLSAFESLKLMVWPIFFRRK